MPEKKSFDRFRRTRIGSGVTPQVLGTLSTTFRIFDFRTFYIGFPSNLLRELLSGSKGAYSSGGHPDRSIYPAVIIPQEVRILGISYFSESGKIQEIFKKRTLHVTVES